MDKTELSAYLWDLRSQSEYLARAISQSQQLLELLRDRSTHHDELRKRLLANATRMEEAHATLHRTLADYCQVLTREAA